MYIYNTIKYKKDISNISKDNREYLLNLKKHLISGSGLINKVLQKAPLPEMHLSLPKHIPSENRPGGSFQNTGKYSYCGPGTKVGIRVAEGYEGVNSLDKACKQHDIYYAQYKKTKDRNKADDILAKQASRIADDSSEPEYVRKDARLVTGIMGLKSRYGFGISKNL